MSDDAPTGSASQTNLGLFIRKCRTDRRMTLRDVEEASGKEVSNAYLSQLEGGKISKPSPHTLYALANALAVPYEALMERAGYIVPTASKAKGEKHGRAATFAVDNLSADEEKAVLEYLQFYRSQRKK